MIPISDARQIKRKTVVVPMFDGELQRLVEVDWVTDMEPVYMGPSEPAQIIVDSRVPEVRMRKQSLRTPGSIEIVFGPGTM